MGLINFLSLVRWRFVGGLVAFGRNGEVLGRDTGRQPYIVLGEKELVPVGMHPPRFDGQHDRLAMSSSDAGGRVAIGGEVYVLSLSGPEPVVEYRVKESPGGPVKQRRGRSSRREAKVDWHGMPLVRPNAIAIDAVARFGVAFDDLDKLVPRQRRSGASHALKELVDVDPTMLVECHGSRRRIVSQNQRQKLARPRLLRGNR